MNAILACMVLAADGMDVSCGAACTYLLVRESNPDVTLRDVVERLPDNIDGHSFVDLAAAADSLGASAAVANVKESGRLPREPFVAHFQSADGGPVGHFVFFRPLEPTFTQYQMIAAPFEPEVVFASDLLVRTDFTGWVMTHRDANASFWTGALLLASGIGLLLLHRIVVSREPIQFALPNAAPTR